MSKRRWLAILVALALLSAVGVTPASAGHGVNGKVCIVNDIGGGEDPFRESAAAGAKQAEAKLHVEVVTLDADTEAEVLANIDAFVTGGCDLIIGIAFIVAGLMEPFIDGNPDQQFAVIDFTFFGAYPNVAEVQFRSDQSAFLAGYIAAGISETGEVGVFGGLPIPAVTIFMDGYALGVHYYNAQYGTTVEVLGWDPDLQTGLFSFDFQDPAAGQAIAADLYDLGADTVFPVAGRTGYGSLDEAELRKQAGESVRVIGVDFDWADEFGDPDRVILTSVVKDFGVAVFNQAAAIADGTWQGGEVWEDLESGAVDIAPFAKTNRQVPGFLKNDLKDIRAGIIDESIATMP
ncbi:MAG: BMP family ABC transporter substrate-binding protein [Acidimicrobiia bacterium]|nr:BMP family ABC transporter substrate-binding protein [Acidimicrobiia bacterium]MDH3470755.1 BMP family ABC transporter substrate-binding protein [Acidimicrobiia bacterium]